ncbi:hypothetical protein GALL_376850 [mine drainage metagenome]|uniref:Uncharacterized protein n=1 Tax=mine drainage metagenome TaxID=410659 RepID=A0A1J5QXF6_9ZZZZ
MRQQARQVAYLVGLFVYFLGQQFGQQFFPADRHCAHFSDDDARGEIGEVQRVLVRQACHHACGKRGDDRVAGSGDVEHLSRHRRDVLGESFLNQRDAFFAARDGQKVQL